MKPKRLVLIKSVFTATLPVCMGYLAIGMAFGLMLESIGYNFIWAAFMSIIVFAGSAQYIAVELLANGEKLLQVALLTLIINFRHMVYGLSMFEKFKGMGKKKLYMIFSLTDETYALLTNTKVPEGTDEKLFYFLVALFDHCYWITGSVIGALAGAVISFDMTGVDFAMTALFVVIATEQWENYDNHIPALLGVGCTVLSLLIFGKSNVLLPALVAVIILLIALRRPILNYKGSK